MEDAQTSPQSVFNLATLGGSEYVLHRNPDITVHDPNLYNDFLGINAPRYPPGVGVGPPPGVLHAPIPPPPGIFFHNHGNRPYSPRVTPPPGKLYHRNGYVAPEFDYDEDFPPMPTRDETHDAVVKSLDDHFKLSDKNQPLPTHGAETVIFRVTQNNLSKMQTSTRNLTKFKFKTMSKFSMINKNLKIDS